jgi:hypothetical protein
MEATSVGTCMDRRVGRQVTTNEYCKYCTVPWHSWEIDVGQFVIGPIVEVSRPSLPFWEIHANHGRIMSAAKLHDKGGLKRNCTKRVPCCAPFINWRN